MPKKTNNIRIYKRSDIFFAMLPCLFAGLCFLAILFVIGPDVDKEYSVIKTVVEFFRDGARLLVAFLVSAVAVLAIWRFLINFVLKRFPTVVDKVPGFTTKLPKIAEDLEKTLDGEEKAAKNQNLQEEYQRQNIVESYIYLLLYPLIVLTVASLTGCSVMLTYALFNRNLDINILVREAFSIGIVTVVINAVAYWTFDGGGVFERRDTSKFKSNNLRFPEYEIKPDWKPTWVDYFVFAVQTSTSFGNSATPVTSKKFKFLVILQTVNSVIAILLLLARAVNIVNFIK